MRDQADLVRKLLQVVEVRRRYLRNNCLGSSECECQTHTDVDSRRDISRVRANSGAVSEAVAESRLPVTRGCLAVLNVSLIAEFVLSGEVFSISHKHSG